MYNQTHCDETKHSGLNGNPKSEHEKTTNRTTIGPTADDRRH